MSTEISIIEGRKEIPDGKTRTSTYEPQLMHLTRFSGGVVNGAMLQLTISNSHIQLTKKEVNRLIKALKEWDK